MYKSAAYKEKRHYDQTMNFASVNREAHKITNASTQYKKTGRIRASDMAETPETDVDIRKTFVKTVQKSPKRK